MTAVGEVKAQPRILPRQTLATRDGVGLMTDVFLPDDLPAPAVLLRTPYGRSQPLLLQLASRMRSGGLAVLLQDCRGRFGSDGTYDLLREGADSEDTASWAVAQPWSDGKVGLFGMSISSLAFFPLAARPPEGVEVGAMVNLMGARDLYSMFYRGGAVQLHWALPWFHLIASEGNGWQGRAWDELFRHEPLESVPEDGCDLSEWRQALAHPERDERWQPLDATDCLREIQAPTLTIAGWQDFMLDQAIDTFGGLTATAPGEHRLIVGPWDHQSLPGNFSLSPAALQRPGALDLTRIVVSWFQRWLRPQAEPAALRSWKRQPVVSYFLLGAGRWAEADTFPPPESESLELFLTSGGDARSAAGDGQLAAEPAASGHDRFTTDPRDPVPTAGGAVWPFPAAGLRPGAADQKSVEARKDVLVYTGPPLAEDLNVVGPVEVVLWSRSSVASSDLTVKLVDVEPGGAARIVQDGVQRLGPEGVEGEGPWTVSMPATGYRFAAGNRVRLEVAGANFPKFDRGAGMPEELARPREQTVFHGGDTPSRLRLPVLPAADRRSHAPVGSLASGELSGRRSPLSAEKIGGAARRVMRPVMAQFFRPSGLFGRVVGRLLAFYNRELNAQAIHHLGVRPTDHVLEVGFGPGLAIRRIAQLASEGRVVGIDHSDVMVRSAKRRNAAAIRRGLVELRQAGVDAMGLEPDSFDRVLTVNSIQLFPSPGDALRAIWAVLKDGGHLVVARQPRGETRSRDRVYDMAARIARQMRDAGFTSVRTSIQPAKPVPIACVIGTKRPARTEGSAEERES